MSTMRADFDNNPALAATPLPFTVIWTHENFKEFLEQAQSEKTHVYLSLLAQYKATLTPNNPIYNGVPKSKVQEALSLELSAYAESIALEEPTLKAAAFNLLALLQRNMNNKDYTLSTKTFEKALGFAPLPALARAGILHNLAFNLRKNLDKALAYQLEAFDILDLNKVHLEDEKRAVASIYSFLGVLRAKEGKFDACEEAHFKALALWPKNNVLANNAALNFSKVNSLPLLLKSEAILKEEYLNAVKKKLFVTPYYRADVNIKLAGLATTQTDKDKYLDIAKECLNVAELVNDPIHGNQSYDDNYRNKNKARLLYLASNLAYVCNQINEAKEKQEQATEARKAVIETAEKEKKFTDKFADLKQPYSSSQLFRRREKTEKERIEIIERILQQSPTIRRTEINEAESQTSIESASKMPSP